MASFDEVIPPGKAGKIKASVHTANYKGSVGKSITVTHDDASQGPITLSVLMKIVGSVEVLPFPAMQIMRHRRGFETPALLLVRRDATEEGTLNLTELASSRPWLKVSARKVKGDEPAVEGIPAAVAGDVVISAQAVGAPVGSYAETLSFKTGLKREPQVTIPVTVVVQPVATMNPPELILTPTAASPDGVSGEVLVSVRDDLDPKMVSVVSDDPAFSVRVDPAGAPAFKLKVAWERKGKSPKTETDIHIRAGDETANLKVRINLAAATAKAL